MSSVQSLEESLHRHLVSLIVDLQITEFKTNKEFKIKFMNKLLVFRNIHNAMKTLTKSPPILVTHMYDLSIMYKEMYRNKDIDWNYIALYVDHLNLYLNSEDKQKVKYELAEVVSPGFIPSTEIL